MHIKQANQSRDKLNKKIKDMSPTDKLLEESTKVLETSQVKAGLEVWIPSLQTCGTILSSHISKSNEVLVQVGIAKMNLKLKQLSPYLPAISNSSKTVSKNVNGSVHTNIVSKTQSVSSEINVIGQTVEEAIYVIDKYIDNCAMANLSPIYIVHGKGTGKLRDGIHKYLRKNSHVKSFRLGTFGEGEMGVTVVEL